MNTIEIIDPNYAPEAGWHRLWRGGHPVDTEADRIAACAPTRSEAANISGGRQITRAMFDLINDDDRELEHEEGTRCWLCEPDGDNVLLLEQDRKNELAYYGVEWDPTIRL